MSAVAHIHGVFDVLSSAGTPFATGPIEIAGRSYTGYVNAPPRVADLWHGVKAAEDDVYLVYDDERITYGEARARVNEIANALIDDFGVRPGDSVGLSLRNYPEWILGWWAIQVAIAVP